MTERGAEGLDPRPERWSALTVPAGAPEDRNAASSGAGGHLPRQGGLPDPGLTRQQDEAAGAGSGGVERHTQPVDELPATDETNNLALR
jgi:hypothetical protein